MPCRPLNCQRVLAARVVAFALMPLSTIIQPLWRDPALWIALASLLFTVASFWWMSARRGRIARVRAPNAFALLSTSAQLLLHLPLVLFNTGAAAIVVENLRIRIPGLRTPAPWAISRRTFYSRDASDHAFPFGVPIGGRATAQLFVEFMLSRPGLTLESGRSYPLDVDALVRGKWTTIVRFQLHVPEASDLGRFLPYSNDHEVMAALLDPKP